MEKRVWDVVKKRLKKPTGFLNWGRRPPSDFDSEEEYLAICTEKEHDEYSEQVIKILEDLSYEAKMEHFNSLSPKERKEHLAREKRLKEIEEEEEARERGRLKARDDY